MSSPRPSSADWTGKATVDRVLDAVVETVPEVRAELRERNGYIAAENPSGERMLAADEFADTRLEERVLAVDGVGSYASEERAEVSTDPDGGDLHVGVDPLDGSSNLNCNNPMGTVVGVYSEPLPTAGSNLVASAYVLYGPNTTLTVTDGDTVAEYLVDDERRLLEADVSIPEDPTVYGIGGREPDWPETVRSFAESLESDRLKLRYGGALVADVTQVLTYGGVFAYPELRGRPEGKLRYLFECAPIGFLVESAGGRVSDGATNFLDWAPDDLHERTPFYVGDPDLIGRRESTGV